jgi:glycosyltransferase involved in cell wall biosynthesis
MASPVAAIGVPLFERAAHVVAALDSLLGQTLREVGLVFVDDCSRDGTAEIAERYAQADERVFLHRNAERLGLVETWRLAFSLAREHWPEARYFAWASDHDLWHEEWLETLVAELDAHPEAVLAYPQSVRVSDLGLPLRGPWSFETAGVRSPAARFRKTCGGLSAGNMIYGLYRAEALEQVGPFPAVIGPDRLLLSRLSLLGEFRQVPRVLWHRRFDTRTSARRQRHAFFVARRPPLHAYLPWWLVHTAVLTRQLVVRGEGRPAMGRAAGLAATTWYAGRTCAHMSIASGRRNLGRLRRAVIRGGAPAGSTA